MMARQIAALFTLVTSLESIVLGTAAACAMPSRNAAEMAGMDMTGMDMTRMDMADMDMPPAEAPAGSTSPSDSEQCSYPWSLPGDCHDMEACAPTAMAAPAVVLTAKGPAATGVPPRASAGPHSLIHTPDPPPPRA